MKIMFVNIPWMKYYVGEGDEEAIVPSSGYNFQYINGCYYGYGEGMEELPLEKIEGVKEGDEEVDDVTVVWTSHNREGENKVIGWYKKATVYRKAKKSLSLDSRRVEFNYAIKAKAENCLLLPMEFRLLDVKEQTEGVHFEEDIKLIQDIAMYIHNYSGDQMNYIFAEKDLEGQSVLNYANYEDYFAKADEFLGKELYGRAVRCFNKAIAVEPELAIGYECKGSVFLSLRMHDEALKVYKKVLEIEPDNELALYCVGLIYGLKGEFEKCIATLTAYLEKRPKDMNAVAERGIAYYNLGEKEKAAEDFKRAHKKEKDHPVFCRLIEYVS